jgi:hypothetical protein
VVQRTPNCLGPRFLIGWKKPLQGACPLVPLDAHTASSSISQPVDLPDQCRRDDPEQDGQHRHVGQPTRERNDTEQRSVEQSDPPKRHTEPLGLAESAGDLGEVFVKAGDCLSAILGSKYRLD